MNKQIHSPAAEQLGLELKKQREHKKLSIGEVAERLKLSARQIEALESGDYTLLPEMVFVRGFLRNYAQFLNLDETIVNQYLNEITPSQQVEKKSPDADKKHNHATKQVENKRGFPTSLLGLGIVVLIVAGVWMWQSKSQSENEKQSSISTMAMPSNQASAELSASNISVVAMPVAQASDVANTAASAASEPNHAQELVLNIRYRSMLTVQDKDGKVLISRIVPAQSEHRFQGNAPYQVRIGYARGSKVSFGSDEVALNEHMIDNKTAAFSVGK